MIEDGALAKAIVFVPNVLNLEVGLVTNAIDDFRRSIIRTIVSNDDFEVGMCLRGVPPEDLGQPFRLIVRSQDDRNEFWCLHGSNHPS